MKTKKMIITAMMSCLSYVLSTFVQFPRMTPFQHMMNVICGVLLEPVWGFTSALITGIISALLVYPFMRLFYGLPAETPVWTFIPAYVPASFVGSILGYVVIMTLKKAGVWKNLKTMIENK